MIAPDMAAASARFWHSRNSRSPTHFLALPLNHSAALAGATRRVQQALMAHNPQLEGASDQLHYAP